MCRYRLALFILFLVFSCVIIQRTDAKRDPDDANKHRQPYNGKFHGYMYNGIRPSPEAERFPYAYSSKMSGYAYDGKKMDNMLPKKDEEITPSIFEEDADDDSDENVDEFLSYLEQREI